MPCPSPNLSLPDTKTQTDTSIHIQKGHGSGGGVREDVVIMWDRSSAQPHFLHIPHSAWDTDCSLKKILLQYWTSMCKIYHGGVRNFNLCFQNRLAGWGQSGEWAGSHTVFFFFGLNTALAVLHSSFWALHLFTGVHLSLARHLPVCKAPLSF